MGDQADVHEGMVVSMCEAVISDIARARHHLNEAEQAVAEIKTAPGIATRLGTMNRAADHLGASIGHMSKARLSLES